MDERDFRIQFLVIHLLFISVDRLHCFCRLPSGESKDGGGIKAETRCGLLHLRSVPGGGPLGPRGGSTHRLQAQGAVHRDGRHLADPESQPKASNLRALHLPDLQDPDACR